MASIKELKVGNYIVHDEELCEVRGISVEENNALVELNAVFSGKKFSLRLEHDAILEDADITRKCGHVISKKKKSIEIMDSNNFKTFNAHIDDSLFDRIAAEDKVTYIQFNDCTKIIELRK